MWLKSELLLTQMQHSVVVLESYDIILRGNMACPSLQTLQDLQSIALFINLFIYLGSHPNIDQLFNLRALTRLWLMEVWLWV